MNNPFEEIFQTAGEHRKDDCPGHGLTARRTAGRKRACVSQNIRCQRHNRVFGQLPVPLSQQGTDTVCQAWAHPTFRHGGTKKVDAAAVCPGF